MRAKRTIPHLLLTTALSLALLGQSSAAAHAADDDINAFTSASALLEYSLRNQPLTALTASYVEDPTSPELTGLLDIVSLRVDASEHLAFEIALADPAVLDPESVVINLVREGDVLPSLSVLDAEGRGWGLYALDPATFAYVLAGDVTFEQRGNLLRVVLSPDDLDTCDYLAFVRTSGISDAFEPLVDEAPNRRQGMRIASGVACTTTPSAGSPG
jgi:hypothetical protein